jgi:biotin transport system substrate-specific component
VSTLAEALPRPASRPSRLAISASLVVAGSLLVAGLAQISIKLPFTPVPITGQTLGVLLVGAALGPLLGGLSLALYLAEGWVGLPFFAQGQHGSTGVLFDPSPGLASAGYIWGFILAAVVVGALSRRGWDRSIRSSIGAMLIGEILLYAVGLVWLAAALNIPLLESSSAFACGGPPGFGGCDALELGLYPFLIGDMFKLLLAAGLLPAAWRLVGRTRGNEPE